MSKKECCRSVPASNVPLPRKDIVDGWHFPGLSQNVPSHGFGKSCFAHQNHEHRHKFSVDPLPTEWHWNGIVPQVCWLHRLYATSNEPLPTHRKAFAPSIGTPAETALNIASIK